MIIPRLVFASFRFQRIRLCLTLLAIALSVSLVVAVSSGIASIQSAGMSFLDRMLGGMDVQITVAHEARSSFDVGVLNVVRQDPAVAEAVGRLESMAPLQRGDMRRLRGGLVQLVGASPVDDPQLRSVNVHHGAWFSGDTGEFAVLDQVVAEKLNVTIGDTITLPGVDRTLKLQITGIIDKPEFLARQLMSIYLPLTTLQDYLGQGESPQLNKILVRLKEGDSVDAFVQRMNVVLANNRPALRVAGSSDYREDMRANLQSVRVLGYIGSMIALIASGFIIFSALAMGVAERQRVMAMMRAIGGHRSQLAWMVLLEAVVISSIGATIGVLLGILWMKILGAIPEFQEFFVRGMTISRSGIVLGAAGAIATAILAGLIPAWQASRVSPLEAMTPLAQSTGSGFPIRSALVGLFLIAIDPFLLWGPLDWLVARSGDPSWLREAKFYGHFTLGLPGVMIGYFLLAPTFVWVIEKILVPVVAPVMGLRIQLLRQQLTGGIWRAAGTAAALMVGLAILISLQTEGHSIVKGWQLPTRFPDMFIASVSLGGLNDAEQAQLAAIKGIARDEDGSPDILPISMSTPLLGSGIFSIAGAAMMPDATMFFGVDPDKALDMMELDFRDGNADDARRMLKLGNHVLITDEFRQIQGLRVGDTFPLQTRSGMIDFIVAGVVWSPGIDVIVSRFDLGRQFEQRTAASVFGSLDDARRYFDVRGINLFAVNLELGVERDRLVDRIKREVGLLGLFAGDIRHIKAMIDRTLMRLLLLTTTVSLAALFVASLGVTNTIMASIRSRRWQFGILRSVGATGGQLFRLILAEAILLGLVGVALGVSAGFQMAWSAHAMTIMTAGYGPPLVVPWGIIGIGGIAVVSASVLASLWPSISVMRTEPLSLLQGGRASA